MDAKLTLKLDKETIEKAKIYAKKKNLSLSRMVERYFLSITSHEKNDDAQYSPLVRELSGILSAEDRENSDNSYTDYLVEKY